MVVFFTKSYGRALDPPLHWWCAPLINTTFLTSPLGKFLEKISLRPRYPLHAPVSSHLAIITVMLSSRDKNKTAGWYYYFPLQQNKINTGHTKECTVSRHDDRWNGTEEKEREREKASEGCMHHLPWLLLHLLRRRQLPVALAATEAAVATTQNSCCVSWHL